MRERVAGCLYGLLVGDALGCPVEGWTASEIAARFGRLEQMTEVPGPRWRPAGLHSDDGQQALLVLDAICRDPERPERGFAAGVVALRRAAPARPGRWGLHRGVGRNFQATVRGLAAHGVDDPFAHATVTAGNGAAMRVAPVALWWRDDAERRDRQAARLSAVTHADLRGIAAAQLLAAAVARGLAPKPAPVLCGELLADLRRAEGLAAKELGLAPCTELSELLAELLAQRERGDDLAQLLVGIATRATRRGGLSRPVAATSGFAPCSVLASLAIVDCGRDFGDALTTAVNLGGDADTVGAMVGALAGAREGIAAIPRAWLAALVARGALEARIDQVVARRVGEPEPELVALELAWDARFEAPPA